MKEIKAVVPQSQNCSFNRFALNLPKLWKSTVPLWFVTVKNFFNLNGVSEEKRKYEFLLGAIELRHLERIERILKNLDSINPYTQVHEALLFAYRLKHKA